MVMMPDQKTRWETVYLTKRVNEVSWYQRQAGVSLDLIRHTVPDASARIIDVGGGASTLVDRLLHAGYSDVSVLGLSPTAR
jgi:beta-lactamase superfamily II metal-dependent hydrolase